MFLHRRNTRDGFISNTVKDYTDFSKSQRFHTASSHPRGTVAQRCTGQSSKGGGCQPTGQFLPGVRTRPASPAAAMPVEMHQLHTEHRQPGNAPPRESITRCIAQQLPSGFPVTTASERETFPVWQCHFSRFLNHFHLLEMIVDL